MVRRRNFSCSCKNILEGMEESAVLDMLAKRCETRDDQLADLLAMPAFEEFVHEADAAGFAEAQEPEEKKTGQRQSYAAPAQKLLAKQTTAAVKKRQAAALRTASGQRYAAEFPAGVLTKEREGETEGVGKLGNRGNLVSMPEGGLSAPRVRTARREAGVVLTDARQAVRGREVSDGQGATTFDRRLCKSSPPMHGGSMWTTPTAATREPTAREETSRGAG